MRVPTLVESLLSTGTLSAGFLTDLSRGGLRLQVREPTHSGSRICVTLRLGHRDALSLGGTVRWERLSRREASWEAGIQFSQMLPVDLLAAIVAEETGSGLHSPGGTPRTWSESAAGPAGAPQDR